MADLVVPPLGESITEAVVSRWLKQVGEQVNDGEAVAELETDKVTVELPSPVAGVMGEQRAGQGKTVKVGEVIGAVTPGAAKAAAPAPAAAPAAAPKKDAPPPVASAATSAPTMPIEIPPSAPNAPTMVVPALRGNNGNGLDRDRLLKLSPSQRAAAREAGSLPARQPAATPAPAHAGPSDADRLAAIDPRDEAVAMSPLRRRVAERLVQAQHEAASLTTFNEVDMSAVMDMRTRYKDAFEKTHGAKLGFMSFFVAACVAACKKFPGINAELVGDHIVYKKHYDFGIAVSTPKGLVVPVLRDCDARSFADIEKGIAELAERARTGKLALPDLAGGTFTITNGGIYGSMMSTPLLNYPQTGILGMHNIVKRAMVVSNSAAGDAVVVKPMMYLALSYDHRVVDGREAVSFLVAVKERLEAPERLLVEV